MSDAPVDKSGHSFTPGPWQVAGQYPDCTFVASRGDNATMVAKCDDGRFAREPVDHAANARLIAAAPDLYEALERMLEVYGGSGKLSQQARAALSRARGES